MSTVFDKPAHDPFQITETVTGDTARLGLVGEFDLTNTDEVVTRAHRQLDSPTIQHVVADLATLDFIGSSGLGALVAIRRLADTHGKTFQISNAHAMVAQVMEITGLTRYLTDPTYTPSAT